MRRTTYFALTCLAMMAVSLPRFAKAAGEIAMDPPASTPGQTVALRWYFTGTKVVISGGRFKAGTVVTGKSSINDAPLKPTRYDFDVWYHPTEPPADVAKLVHAHYSVVANVVLNAPKISSYKDPRGWSVRYVGTWNRDVSTPDDGQNSLIFFQPEMDSVERIAVAMRPAKDMSSLALVDKVKQDMPQHYEKPEVISDHDFMHGDVPTHVVNFTGFDPSHPGTKTQSLVLTFVRDGRAYIISVRTAAAKFKERQPLLESLMWSFALPKQAASVSLTKQGN